MLIRQIEKKKRQILHFCSLKKCPSGKWSQITFYVNSFTLSENCRQLEFKPSHTFDGKRLKDHVIRTVDVMDGDFCEMVCYLEPSCVSYNLEKTPSALNGNFKCELNNSTFEGQKEKLEKDRKFIYRGAKASVAFKLRGFPKLQPKKFLISQSDFRRTALYLRSLKFNEKFEACHQLND